MARAILGPTVTDMRGKLGQTVFQRGPGQTFTRGWIKTPNNKTPAQVRMRTLEKSLITTWKNTLTEAQRVQWNFAAEGVTRKNSLGNTAPISGFNLFMKRLLAGSWWGASPAAYDYPGTATVTNPGAMTVSATVATNLVTFTVANAYNSSTELPVLFITRALSPGRYNLNSFYRGNALAAPTGGPLTWQAFNVFSDQGGTLKAGDALGIKFGFINKNTWQLGPQQIARCIIQEGDAMLQTVTTLTSTQILALFGTPVTLIPAQGANTIIRVFSVTMHLIAGSNTYTASGNLQIMYGNPINISLGTALAANILETAAGDDWIFVGGLEIASDSNFNNQPIAMQASSAPTGGNGQLVVVTNYAVDPI